MRINASKIEVANPKKFSIWAKSLFLSNLENSRDLVVPWHSRIDIYPHQVETVIHSLRMEYPRIIYADEVGLGKTIEAGMAIKELIRRNKGEKILIVVPSNLTTQWQREMANKFYLYCQQVDSSNITSCFENPSEIYGGYIISIDLAKTKKEMLASIEWDIIVFDEAHHLRRHYNNGRYKTTKKFELADCLKDKTKSLLLLTATPFQLNDFEFYSLIYLIRPDIFPRYEDFLDYRNIYLPKILEVISNMQKMTADIHSIKNLLLKFSLRFNSILEVSESDINEENIPVLLDQCVILSKLVIRHKKRDEFPSLPPRKVKTIAVNYSEEEMGLYDDITQYIKLMYNKARRENNNGIGLMMVIFQQLLASSPRALLNALELRLKKINQELKEINPSFEDYDDESNLIDVINMQTFEGEKEAILEFIERINSLSMDNKLAALINIITDILIKQPDEKVIIFTRFLNTQDYLKNVLERHFKVIIFNGKQKSEEKDEAIINFEKLHQVLISTEAGGEGRNLQFCHILINYDIPWNPTRLEQRIGRVDRIGQKKTVLINNLATFNTVEQRILERVSERIFLFEELLGSADPIIGDIEEDIKNVLFSNDEDIGNKELIFEVSLEEKLNKAKEASKQFEKLQIFQQKLRDKKDYFKEEKSKIEKQHLLSYLLDFASVFSDIEVYHIGEELYNIILTRGNFFDSDRELIATFEKSIALSKENVEFITPDHWIIQNIFYKLLQNQNIFVTAQKNREAKPYLLLFYTYIVEGKEQLITVLYENKEYSIVNKKEYFKLSSMDLDDSLNKEKIKSMNIQAILDQSVLFVNKVADFKSSELVLRGIYFSKMEALEC